jgi:hypothetical protein
MQIRDSSADQACPLCNSISETVRTLSKGSIQEHLQSLVEEKILV